MRSTDALTCGATALVAGAAARRGTRQLHSTGSWSSELWLSGFQGLMLGFAGLGVLEQIEAGGF